MVTPDEVGAMANSLSRNEILSANEFRSILGFKPNDEPRSDQLINKNMPVKDIAGAQAQTDQQVDNGSENQNGTTVNGSGNELSDLEAMLNDSANDTSLDDTEALLDQLEQELNG